MHPDRVIVRMYRRSDGLSTRPDYQNTLTHQSADTNDAPRDPLTGPVTSWTIFNFEFTLFNYVFNKIISDVDVFCPFYA